MRVEIVKMFKSGDGQVFDNRKEADGRNLSIQLLKTVQDDYPIDHNMRNLIRDLVTKEKYKNILTAIVRHHKK